MTAVNRASGALYGLALGDALGMPTQALSPDTITRLFGTVADFADAPTENPISAGMHAGSVTDDTDQTLIVARLLVEGEGRIDDGRLCAELMDWDRRMRESGSRDLLGPSTKAALDAVAAGASVSQAGRNGNTNGAAMRIAPVGVAVPAKPLPRLVDEVERACQVTHATSTAIAGAAAVAAAVSLAVQGGAMAECVELAVAAAEIGSLRGNWDASADIASRIRDALELVERAKTTDAVITAVRAHIGTSVASQESIPAAFAVLSLGNGDPWRTCLLAANLGGDCDTIGAMAGAIAGALHGAAAIPATALDFLRSRNELAIEPLVRDLLRLRADRTS